MSRTLACDTCFQTHPPLKGHQELQGQGTPHRAQGTKPRGQLSAGNMCHLFPKGIPPTPPGKTLCGSSLLWLQRGCEDVVLFSENLRAKAKVAAWVFIAEVEKNLWIVVKECNIVRRFQIPNCRLRLPSWGQEMQCKTTTEQLRSKHHEDPRPY